MSITFSLPNWSPKEPPAAQPKPKIARTQSLSYLLNANHYTAPFSDTIETEEGCEDRPFTLSTNQKIVAVALAILVGWWTFGIGGIVVFFLTTAYFKSKKVQDLTHEFVSSQLMPNSQPDQKSKKPPKAVPEPSPVKTTADKTEAQAKKKWWWNPFKVTTN